MNKPPAYAERLLRLLLPEGMAGQSILGDLREEYLEWASGADRKKAALWYWRTVVALAVRYRLKKLRTALTDRSGYGWSAGDSSMKSVTRDFRIGARQLRRSPGFALVLIATLALGIGANTTIFSVVNGLLLRPLPYPAAERLVTLNHVYPSVNNVAGVSPPGFRDYRDRTRSFETVAICRGLYANLTGVGEPERLTGGRVSTDYFTTYGIAPALGRSFLAAEDTPGNEHVVILSHGFWTTRLGSDPRVLERHIVLNDESYQVIGVMPPGFEDFFGRQREFWVPVALPPEQFTDDYRFSEAQSAIARLRPGVTVEAASQELTALAETIKAELTRPFPRDWTVRVTSLQAWKTADYRTTLLVLLGAVGFVLLITCANVANLLLAGGIDRQKEIAIRKALGASPLQVGRQLLAESLLLSFLGGSAGVLLSVWGTDALQTVGPDALRNATLSLDTRVLGFTLGVTLLAGLLFGIAPALHGIRRDLQTSLRDGGQSSRSDRMGGGLRKALIVSEFAIAVVLLAGSGLMIKTISALRNVDPGFDPDHVVTANLMLPRARYPDVESQTAFFDQLLLELGAEPGVFAAATTDVLPFGGNWSTGTFSVEGFEGNEDGPSGWGDMRIVSPRFLEALGIPLMDGRFFDLTDGPNSPPVAVVDEELARRFWPGQSAIGKRVTTDFPIDSSTEWFTVIGVVGHTLHDGLDDDVRVQLYGSSRQFGSRYATLVLRTETEPESIVRGVRQIALSIDPAQPVSDIRIMEDLITDSIGNRQFLMTLLTLFSGLAISLASLGIYGIMSHAVHERSRELGLRMALGANRPSVFGMVLNNGLKLAGIGLVLGLGGSLTLTRLMQSQLFDVNAVDPYTLIAVTAILLAVAVVAICIPAHRASKVDPIANLKAE